MPRPLWSPRSRPWHEDSPLADSIDPQPATEPAAPANEPRAAAAQDQEAGYRRALDGMLEAVTILGRDWTYRYVNDTAARYLGRPRAELEGHRIPELFPAFMEQELFARFSHAMDARKPEHFEFPVTVAGDGARWFDFRLDPVDEGLLVLSLDITDRRTADDAVRVSEARLRGFVNSNIFGVVMTRPDGSVLDANAYFLDLIGYTRAELDAGLVDWRTLTPPEWAASDATALRELGLNGRTEPREKEYRRRDGSRVWVLIAHSRISGAQVEFASAVLDVSDRHWAEVALQASAAALRDSEERFRVLAEHSLSGVYIIDRGELSYVNPTLARTFGYTPEEMTGLAWTSVVHPDDRALVLENIRRRLDGELASLQYEFTGVRKDGTSVPVLVFGAATELSGQTVIIGNIIDLTERRELEERLRQAHKLEAVGQLAGGIAHDFNNLLTAIRGYSELVDASLGEDDPARADLEQIRQSTERAAALTRQLLAFSRRQTLAPEVLDPADVIDGIAPLIGRLLGEDIVLTTRHALDHDRVLADRSQLEQVIVNLSVNARDAMPAGGRLSIYTSSATLAEGHVPAEPDTPAGRYVRITVTDTGCGIDPAVRGRIFEPYFTTKEVGRGTGMGLATVYGIVRQSGGRISFESEVDRGTTFVIELPCVDARPAVDAVDAPPTSRASTGSETVLVVEDEAVIRAYMRRILTARGYTVIDAPSAAAGLLLVRDDAVLDLVVTDMVMPGMQGVELVESLRASRPGLPAVVISGFTGDALENVRGLSLLQKPFDADAFLATVREAIDRPRD